MGLFRKREEAEQIYYEPEVKREDLKKQNIVELKEQLIEKLRQ